MFKIKINNSTKLINKKINKQIMNQIFKVLYKTKILSLLRNN